MSLEIKSETTNIKNTVFYQNLQINLKNKLILTSEKVVRVKALYYIPGLAKQRKLL